MNRTIRYTAGALAALFLSASLAACGSSSSTEHDHAQHRNQEQSPAGDLKVISQISDFTLTNQANQPISLAKDTPAKAKLVYFFFTNCDDVCPVTTGRMASILKQLENAGVAKEDLKFLSVTVDPKRDNTEALQQYADKFSADPNVWNFLTGSEEQLQPIYNQFGVSPEQVMMDSGESGGEHQHYDVMHNDRIFLLDEKNQLRTSFLMGPDMEDKTLVDTIRKLIKEQK